MREGISIGKEEWKKEGEQTYADAAVCVCVCTLYSLLPTPFPKGLLRTH